MIHDSERTDDRADPLAVMARLWRQERETTAARLAAERRDMSLGERVEQGIALRDLRVDETGAAPGGRRLLWLASPELSSGGPLRVGPGDPVRLWWEDPDADDAVRGVVARRRGDRLGVMVSDRDAVLDYLDGSGFRLDREAPQTTFERGAAALAALRAAAKRSDLGRWRRVLLGQDAPDFGTPPDLDWLDTQLNAEQQAAVAHALAARDLALVHGPPGTGKTRVLVEVVRQAVARGDRVLATAASNAAVDHLAARLAAAGVPVVRLGHPARVSPAVEARSLDTLVEATDDYARAKDWLAEADRIRRRTRRQSARGSLSHGERRAAYDEAGALVRDAYRQIDAVQARVLDEAPVICATAAGSDTALLSDIDVDLVVLDEATQAVDPIALVPLRRARRAVLAGDHRQLPPTVIDQAAAQAGLGTTFFERLATAQPDAVRRLETQYRMHADLMAFPSRAMYDDRLTADPTVVAHRLADLPGVEPDPLRPGPLLFVDSAGKGWEEERATGDSSTRNPEQAVRVAAEVRRLLGRGLSPERAAVITPYRAQVRQLRRWLADELAAGLEVDTIDAFQGREKEAVIVDLVRANPDGALGFLEDTRRMNVALTRARRFLLVVGDSATIGAHPFYAAFLETVDAAGGWLSAWEDDAPGFEEGQ